MTEKVKWKNLDKTFIGQESCDRCGKVAYEDEAFCEPCIREILKPPFTALKEALQRGSNMIESADGRIWIYDRHYGQRRSYFLTCIGQFNETRLTVLQAYNQSSFKPYYPAK